MNAIEFIAEVKNSDICPNNFDDIYGEFQQYQSILLSALNELHRICKKNNIHYQLAFGSLLGAIRDDGQIPWDYDIDVLVPYEEKEQLLLALKNDIDYKHFYFAGADVNSKCGHSVLRMAPNEFDTKKLHVDIFYLIGSYDEKEKRMQHEKNARRYFYIRFVKAAKFHGKSVKGKIWLGLRKFLFSFVSMKTVNKRLDSICNKVPVSASNVSIPLIYGAYDGICFDTKMMLDIVEYKTENGIFNVPRDYEKILTTIYKDYRKIYPLENRLKEMLNMYQDITGKKIREKALNNVESGRYYSK